METTAMEMWSGGLVMAIDRTLDGHSKCHISAQRRAPPPAAAAGHQHQHQHHHNHNHNQHLSNLSNSQCISSLMAGKRDAADGAGPASATHTSSSSAASSSSSSCSTSSNSPAIRLQLHNSHYQTVAHGGAPRQQATKAKPQARRQSKHETNQHDSTRCTIDISYSRRRVSNNKNDADQTPAPSPRQTRQQKRTAAAQDSSASKRRHIIDNNNKPAIIKTANGACTNTTTADDEPHELLAAKQQPEQQQHQQQQQAAAPRPRISMDDFDLLKLLGTGAYGKVFLVRKLTGHDKGKLYAMKVLRKELVAQKTKTLERMRTERKVLESIRNEPFLVTMHYAFQTKSKLHLILDYVNGGELFTHLYQRDHFKENEAKIYIGELILALEKLHKVS
jgi:hypothetical protein